MAHNFDYFVKYQTYKPSGRIYRVFNETNLDKTGCDQQLTPDSAPEGTELRIYDRMIFAATGGKHGLALPYAICHIVVNIDGDRR